MPSVVNKLTVAELARRLGGVKNAVLVDFTGLNAVRADALRAQLREQGAEMLVVKNSLAARALEGAGLGAAAGLLKGPTAFVVGDEPASLARFLRDWSRRERVLSWRGALVDGQVVGPEGVDAIAALPPLPVLRGMAVSAIAAPLSGLVGALTGVLRNVVGVLKAIAEKDESSG